MKKMVFGVVNKIFLAYEKPFLNPDISEIIVLWNKVDDKVIPMEERWYRKIYSFCKGKSIFCYDKVFIIYFKFRKQFFLPGFAGMKQNSWKV